MQERRQSAGLFLQSIKSIKKNISSFESEDDFGEKFHTRSSEPYYFESAYCHVKCNKVFPVNEKGQLVIADYVENTKSDRQQTKTNGNSRDDENRPSAAQLTNSHKGQCTSADCVHNATSGPAGPLGRNLSDSINGGSEAGPSREGFDSFAEDPEMSGIPTNYKCSYLCRPLPQTEIDAIVTLRQAVDRPVKQLRSILQSCDKDCPNPHYQSFYVHLEVDPDNPDIIYTYILSRDLRVTLCCAHSMAAVRAKSEYSEQHLLITAN